MSESNRRPLFPNSEEEQKKEIRDVIQSPFLEFYYFPKLVGHIAIRIPRIKDSNDLCDVLLMALPEQGKTCLETDRENLYLYKDDEGIFYWKDGRRENLILGKKGQKYFVLLEEEDFDGTEEKPRKLKNIEACKAILKVTFAAKHTNSNVYPFEGLYLSYGSNCGANFDYSKGLRKDTTYYGVPVKIILQLPPTRISRLNYIASSYAEDSNNYSLLHNNCADAGLMLLKDLLPATSSFKETSLTTTPANLMNQVCSFILNQIQADREAILTKKKLSLNNLLEIIELEQERLSIEIKQEKTGFITTETTKNIKIAQLGMLKDALEDTTNKKTPEAYLELLKQFDHYQKIIGGRTAQVLEICIAKFPYGKSKIVDSLIKLYENIKKEEQDLRNTTWTGRIKGLDNIIEKLDIQKLKEYQANKQCPREVIGQYFEIEAIINRKANDGKTRDPKIQRFYDSQLTLFAQVPKREEKLETHPAVTIHARGSRKGSH